MRLVLPTPAPMLRHPTVSSCSVLDDVMFRTITGFQIADASAQMHHVFFRIKRIKRNIKRNPLLPQDTILNRCMVPDQLR